MALRLLYKVWVNWVIPHVWGRCGCDVHREDTITSGHLMNQISDKVNKTSGLCLGVCPSFFQRTNCRPWRTTYVVLKCRTLTGLHSSTKHVLVESRLERPLLGPPCLPILLGLLGCMINIYCCIAVHISATFVVVQEPILAKLLIFL